MGFIGRLILWLAAGAGALAAASPLLPEAVRIERHERVSAPPGMVFDWLNSHEFAKEAASARTGPPSGIGAKVAWNGTFGQNSYEVIESADDKLVRIKASIGQLGDGILTISLEADPPGSAGSECKRATRLSAVFESAFGWNPVSRYKGLLLQREVAPTLDATLPQSADLALKVANCPFNTNNSTDEIDVPTLPDETQRKRSVGNGGEVIEVSPSIPRSSEQTDQPPEKKN